MPLENFAISAPSAAFASVMEGNRDVPRPSSGRSSPSSPIRRGPFGTKSQKQGEGRARSLRLRGRISGHGAPDPARRSAHRACSVSRAPTSIPTARAFGSTRSRRASQSCWARTRRSSCPAARWPSKSPCASSPIATACARSRLTRQTISRCTNATGPRACTDCTSCRSASVRPMTAADVRALAEPVATLLIEIPQRELGGIATPWEEARGHRRCGPRARLARSPRRCAVWESAEYYRPLVRRHRSALRFGLRLVLQGYWGGRRRDAVRLAAAHRRGAHLAAAPRRQPGVALSVPNAAEVAFDLRVERMPAYCAAARFLAEIVAAQPGTVAVAPSPPAYEHVPRLPARAGRRLQASGSRHRAQARRVDRPRAAPTAIDGIIKWEISAGDAAVALGPNAQPPSSKSCSLKVLRSCGRSGRVGCRSANAFCTRPRRSRASACASTLV